MAVPSFYDPLADAPPRSEPDPEPPSSSDVPSSAATASLESADDEALDSVARPSLAPPEHAARPTRAEIDLAAVRRNYRELEACLGASAADRPPAQLWPVLKADAYGHGARSVGTTLERAGARGMCVALLEEGIELRNAGVRCPILVMGGAYGRFRDAMEALVLHDLTPVVYDRSQLESLSAAVAGLGRADPCSVHLKVDTGMGRLGVRGEELGPLLAALGRDPRLRLVGVMTHLACADEADWSATGEQLRQLEAAITQTRAAGHAPVVCHAANSAALVRWPATHFDAVRPGIALFGVHPCPAHREEGARPPKLRPVLRVRSEIVALRDLPVGAAVGYGHDWRARRRSVIGTIPMGYADGINRAMATGGAVLVAGRRAPIVGAVSMDLTTIDLTDHPGVRVHDEVMVLGSQRGRLGSDSIEAAEIAARSGTIPYEVLTSISRRVPRFYRHA